jgi:hypothetical protein
MRWKQQQRIRLGHRIGFGLIATLLLFILVSLPLVISSVTNQLLRPHAGVGYALFDPTTPPAATHSRLTVDLIEFNEWEETAKLKISGIHVCHPACSWNDRFLFVSALDGLSLDPEREGLPPADSVTLPPTAQNLNQDITLPLTGYPIRYPFDSYQLGLGVIMQRVFADGSVQNLSPAEAAGHLSLKLANQIPRMRMGEPLPINAQLVPNGAGQYQYLVLTELTFTRPLYLQILTVLLVLLITAAAAYAVFAQPVSQLVVNASALILGIWGIRTILVGGALLPGLSAIDLSLSIVILFLLVAIAVRMLRVFWERGELQVPWPGRSRRRS